MPVLSLPLFLPSSHPIWVPIRIPFPMMRIGSILPASINGPVKSSLLALFDLAWSNKVQLPLLITICFMAFDIRLQLEINIFWENPRGNGNGNGGGRQRRVVREDVARGGGRARPPTSQELQATVATTTMLLQRQRQLLQERARQQELEGALNGGRHNFPSLHVEDTTDEDDGDETETGEEETGSRNPVHNGDQVKRRKRKRKTTGEAQKEGDDDEDTEEEDNTGDESDDDDNDDDDDDFSDGNDDDGAASQNPDLFGDSDNDHDFSDDNSQGRGSGSDDDGDSNGAIPLVVELEIRQRPAFKAITTRLCSIVESFCMSFVHSLKRELLVPFLTNDFSNISQDVSTTTRTTIIYPMENLSDSENFLRVSEVN